MTPQIHQSEEGISNKRRRETGWPFGKKKLTCDYSTPCEDKIHMDKNTRRKHGKKFE